MGQVALTTGRHGTSEPGATTDIALLGRLTVTRGGVPVELSGPVRRALLILLALNAGVPVGRDRVVEALWPERPTGREESTLRVHVSHLRDALEPDRAASPRVLLTVGSSYMLDRDQVSVDIARFEQLVREGRSLLSTNPEAALPLLNGALELWRGRPLEDVEYQEFAQDEIRRLEMARIEAVEDRAEALIELGEDVAAIEDLEALVRTQPTDERPVRLLMRALYRTGRQAESLRVARRHARHLAEQGLDPSPQVSMLQERILHHDPTLLPVGTVSSGDLKPGRSVRGYELREEAGSGTVGVVYRAFQSSVGREVAVKVVHPRFTQSPEFVRRFADEARLVARLEHPHIVPLHDFWRDPVGAFLVMRWMDGGSLLDRLGGHWSGDELVRVFGQLADALGHAHSAGVVHRDVKPANVLFDTSGNAYLCDFGLAVTGIDTGVERGRGHVTAQPPYASPEVLQGEGASVASDVYALGVLLAEAASGGGFQGIDASVDGAVGEVVRVATSPNPADRYPDMAALKSALDEASGTTPGSVPRRLRRNPFKGLAAFDEGDRADFYGRDDVIETLVGMVESHGLTAIIGASGSGKSSVVMAGLVPQFRDGALPGSDEWAIVRMVPGTDPFEEFHIALRDAAVGRPVMTSDRSRELRDGFAAALDGPSTRALLVVDQFEEVFSSQVDEAARETFLDNLVDLALDPSRRVTVVVTLRADFSDRPLAHPRFGPLMSDGAVMLSPMRPEQVEEVIRRPAARVGVQIEPGLVAEIVRDVAEAPGYLPLLQYVLSELFERRDEDRLTVREYRALGGVQGVLERRADATFVSLRPTARDACRQLFLRMVHLGDGGEETRRRLPLTELHGLGMRAEVDQALEAFSDVRLLTYDRDPLTRTPTVEVAHETVFRRWTRYRIWIDEARADLLAHRRLSSAAATWANANEDPSFLMVGGPLAAAVAVASGDRISLNALESRFVSESRHADEASRVLEADRRREETVLRQRARRRLVAGVAALAVAGVIALFATFAWVERQRADDLAALQERQSLARELAAVSVSSLAGADPDLSLLLALAAAETSLDAGEPILPEVVDALHQAVINPRPELIIDGVGSAMGGMVVDYAADGSLLVVLSVDDGAIIIDPSTGAEQGRISPVATAAFGVAFHPDGQRVLSIHRDAVRQWVWRTEALEFELGGLPDGVDVTTAAYARDGTAIAVGRDDGVIEVWDPARSQSVELHGHTGRIVSVDFDPTGTRLVSGGADMRALVWDLASGTIATRARLDTIILPLAHLAWHPSADVVAVTTQQGEILLFDAGTGERLNSFGTGQHHSHAVAFDTTGTFVVAAGVDGAARIFGTWTGGEASIVLPTGGVPLRDAAFDPRGLTTVATVGVDGRLRIWRDILRSELPPRPYPLLYPQLVATPDGSRYLVSAHLVWLGSGAQPWMEVVDASTGSPLIRRLTAEGWGGRMPAISADGAMAAFVGPSGDAEIVQVDTGVRTPLVDSAAWTASLAFSPDGGLLAGGGIDGSIAIWDLAARDVLILHGHGDRRPRIPSVPSEPGRGLGDPLAIFGATSFRVAQVAFRPDGSELASSGFDGTVRAWDPVTGEGRVLRAFDHELSSMAYSPDGALIATVDRAGSVMMLDADSGDVVNTLDPVSGWTELAFSPDGRYLAGAGPGSEVHLWDLETGRIVRRIQGAIYRSTGVGFANGGRELWVASGEGVVRGYVLDPLALVELARGKVTRDLTAAECGQYVRRACGP